MKSNVMLLLMLIYPQMGGAMTTDSIAVQRTDSLREVVVLGHAVKQDAEGYRVNLSAIPQLQSMNLEEALAFLPGMEVADERIKVYNKDVARVYVNRRQVRLSGASLMAYLRSFDVRNIKEVRVVAAAGAEFSATEAGMAIVRITTHRIDDGGQLTLGGNTFQTDRLHTYTLPSANVQLRYGKWSVYGNGSYGWSHSEIDSEGSNTFLNSGIQTISRQTTANEPRNGDETIGVGFDIGKNDYVTAEVAYKHSTSPSSVALMTTTKGPDTPESSFRNIGSSDNRTNAMRGTLDFSHIWPKGQLTLSATYNNYDMTADDENQREDNPTLWSTASATRTDRQHWEVRGDIEQQLPDKWGRLKTGLLASSWRNDDNTRNRLTQNGIDNPFATYTDLYNYRENNYAAYISWQYQLRQASLSAGLRYEHRTIDPRSQVNPERNHRSDYDNLYPNIQIGYNINQIRGQSLRLSYSHGVSMPFMNMLNPTVRWQSEYQYTTGNPFLQPATFDALSGTLTLWHRYWFSLSWERNSQFNPVYFESNTPNLYYSTYINGKNNHSVSLSAGGTKQFAKWLMVNGNVIYFHQTSNYQQLSVTSNHFHASLSVTSMLPLGFNLRINGMYDTSNKQLTYQTGDHWQLSTGLTKQLLNRRLTLSLNYICVPRYTNQVETGGIVSTQCSLLSPHRIGLSVRYNLQWGKQMLKIRRSSGASEDSRRGN